MIKIPRCYDSHLHLIPTGEMKSILNLRGLQSPQDLKFLMPMRDARRGRWLMGFGWDGSRWEQAPHRKILDEIFAEDFVAFSRTDGHALWVNTAALRELGFWRRRSEWSTDLVDFVEFDSDDWPTGILLDRALEKAFEKIPKMSHAQMRGFALSAVESFRNQGFTHLREMMADADTWRVLRELDEARDLRAHVEVNFHCPKLSNLSSVIRDYQSALTDRTLRLRPAGIKIFVDGAMGSEGALLSEPYQGGCHHGFQLWTPEELTEGFAECWRAGIPVAVHVIGDQAARLALQSAQSLHRQGVVGILHLEHLQMLDPKDLALFKDLSVFCHFQPSHFLSDQKWIKAKLGDRSDWVFPWKRLEMAGYPFFFGSDAPIEEPSLRQTKLGLEALVQFGHRALELSWTFPHSHPDSKFGPKCFSEVDPEGNLLAVVFDGERLI